MTAAVPPDLLKVRALLDDALVGLRLVEDPRVPVRTVSGHLRAALGHLYTALASTGEATLFHREAAAAFQRAEVARVLLDDPSSTDPALHTGLKHVAEALEGWKQTVPLRPTKDLDLPKSTHHVPYPRALKDVPALVQMDRAVLQPAVVMPVKPVTEPTTEEVVAEDEGVEAEVTLQTVEALLAKASADVKALEEAEEKGKAAGEEEEQPSGPLPMPELAKEALGVTVAREERELECARSFFEELGMLGLMRQPDDGDLWSDLGRVEERLLARVDAILACGDWVLPQLVRYLEDRPVPDPELTWAALFLYGSLAGDDALHQVVRLLRTVDLEEPEVRAAAVDALAYAPNPDIESVVREWIAGPSPAQALLAVGTLGRRGALDVVECARLIMTSPLLCPGAIEALRHAPGTWTGLDAAPLLKHEDPLVVSSALEALLRRRVAAGPKRAHAWVAEGKGDFADAYLWTALTAGDDGWEVLWKALEGKPSDGWLEAVGWLGNLQAMDVLLGLLSQGDVRVVGALQRLTGASLTDDAPDPEYDEGEGPFARAFTPPPDELELTEKHEIWSAWWEKHRARASLRKRYRFGSLWTPRTNLWEMEAAPFLPRARRLAYLELVARTGETHPFDPSAFVAEQRKQLLAWRTVAESSRAAPGSWPMKWSGP